MIRFYPQIAFQKMRRGCLRIFGRTDCYPVGWALVLLFATTALHASQSTIEGYLVVLKGSARVISPVKGQENRIAVIEPTDGGEKGIPLIMGNTVKTGEFSSALIIGTEGNVLHRLGELTSLQLGGADGEPEYSLLSGVMHFFSRMGGKEQRYKSGVVTAAIKGTEFTMSVDPSGQTVLHLSDGAVELTTATERRDLQVLDRATIDTEGAISVERGLRFGTEIEWFIPYPLVLLIDELPLDPPPNTPLAESIAAYQRGAIRKAVDYLNEPSEEESAIRLYRAALYLALGQVEDARNILTNITEFHEQTWALRAVMALSNGTRQAAEEFPLTTASAFVAQSYRLQADGRLSEAVSAINSALSISKETPPGWLHARKGKLLFATGNREQALKSYEAALNAAPELAAAWSGSGFLHLANNEDTAARKAFDKALRSDPGFAEAWLGVSILAFRSRDMNTGRESVKRAISLSPVRASFRGYLARIFMESGQYEAAKNELEIARDLDPSDPNLLLLSGIERAASGDIKSSIRAIESSIRNNDSRGIFRAPPLLAEDEAIRRANLAQIFDQAELSTFAIREAMLGLERFPSSYRAHQFLANALGSLQDPTTRTLRYQSPYQAERLKFNLLSPARAGFLSLPVTPNDYHRLLTPLGVRFSGRLAGSIEHGISSKVRLEQTGNRSSAFSELSWNRLDGFGGEWDFERREYEAGFKTETGNKNTFTLLGRYFDRQNLPGNPEATQVEENSPTAIAAWKHDWDPDATTLATVQWISFDADTYGSSISLVADEALESVLGALSGELRSDSSATAWQAEIQHSAMFDVATVEAGIRTQSGSWKSRFTQTASSLGTELSSAVDESFFRLEGYAYSHFDLSDGLILTTGLNATRFEYPQNVFTLPPDSDSNTVEKLQPKIGLTWRPNDHWSARGAYSVSLGGLALEDGYRLEPGHVAGFLQGYRTLLAEALDGTHPALEFKTGGLGITYSSASEWYFDFEWNHRTSDSEKGLGVFQTPAPLSNAHLNTITQYQENVLSGTIAKILSRSTTLSLELRHTDAQVDAFIPSIQTSVQNEARLFEVYATFHYLAQNGLFGTLNFGYLNQESSSTDSSSGGQFSTTDNPDRTQWLGKLTCGWRSHSGKSEIRVEIENLLNDPDAPSPLTWSRSVFPERVATVVYSWNY